MMLSRSTEFGGSHVCTSLWSAYTSVSSLAWAETSTGVSRAEAIRSASAGRRLMGPSLWLAKVPQSARPPSGARMSPQLALWGQLPNHAEQLAGAIGLREIGRRSGVLRLRVVAAEGKRCDRDDGRSGGCGCLA